MIKRSKQVTVTDTAVSQCQFILNIFLTRTARVLFLYFGILIATVDAFPQHPFRLYSYSGSINTSPRVRAFADVTFVSTDTPSTISTTTTALFVSRVFHQNGNKPPYSTSSTNSTNNLTMRNTSIKSKNKDQSLERQIITLGRRGQTDAALHLFESIQPNPTLRQVNAAIDACARAYPVRLAHAFSILEDQQKKASNSQFKPNVYTYGALMNAASRAGDVDTALQLLETMEPTVRPNAVVYQSAVTAAANAGRPDLALKLLQQARESLQSQKDGLTIVGYNAAVSAAAKACDASLAVQLLTTLKTDPSLPNPDAVTYGTVLSACEKAGEWNLVLQIMSQAEEERLVDGMALMSALHACQQLGLADRAIRYLDLMKELDQQQQQSQRKGSNSKVSPQQSEQRSSATMWHGPDAVAYRMVISACARGNQWQDGIALLEEYGKVYPNHKDVRAYTAAITGCEYAGEWQQALLLLKRMRQNGVEPNEVTFAAVLGACATGCANLIQSNKNGSGNKDNHQNHDDDNKYPLPLRKALLLTNVLRKDKTVVKPNIQVYNAAIRACAEGLSVEKAFQLLNTLRDDGLQPTLITYGTLMTASERVGSVAVMSEVFSMMRADAIEPNEIVYGAALSCCRKAGESDRAYSLLCKMIQHGLQPNAATFNTVLVAQSEAIVIKPTPSLKALHRSLAVFQMMNNKNYTDASPNRQTYRILIRLLTANQKPREAEALLQRMRQEDLMPDVDLFTDTVAAYERTGQPVQALRLMEAMRADGYDFYETKVLDAAFKRVVKLANTVMIGRARHILPDLHDMPLLSNETSTVT